MARNEILPGVWAETAETTIPVEPQTSTTYRDPAFDLSRANKAWPFNRIVNSADTNQFLYLMSKIVKETEEKGIIEWSSLIDYSDKAWARGSDGDVYKSVQTPNLNKDPITSPEYWELFGAVGAETVERSLLIETGFTYAQIQAVYDGIGSYIRWDTVVTVLWEDGTYNIGANAIHVTDYGGGGLLTSKAINPTGAGATTKNVTIIGSGGTAYPEFPPYSSQFNQRYLFFLSGCGTFCFFGDLEMILTGTPINRSAVLAGLRSGFSLTNCVIKNQVTTGNTAYGVESQFGSAGRVAGCFIQAPIGFGGVAACVAAGSNGLMHSVDSTGSADYGYRPNTGIVFADNDGIAASVAQSLVQLGEIYI